jgi:hypothetical protein
VSGFEVGKPKKKREMVSKIFLFVRVVGDAIAVGKDYDH